MPIIKPMKPPRTEYVVRKFDNKKIRWVEKPLSTLYSNELIKQINPFSGKRNWCYDHYVWVMEDVKRNFEE